MLINYETHQRLIKALLQYDVKFLVIGGYAVNFHGYARTTGDLDIWLQPTNENKRSFINALRSDGFDEEQLKELEKLDFTQPNFFFTGQAPLRIDFLTKISGISFEEAFKEKEIFGMQEYKVPILNIQHLILSKISNDRTRDKADVEELQRIRKQQH